MLFYCGIDIAKRNHEASVIDAEGKPLLDSITITNTQEGCEKLFSLFERLGVGEDDIIIGMEATGHYWLSVYEYLTEKQYDVRVINPIQSDAFRKMYIRQTKNDSKDSFIIAQVMRFGQYSDTTLSDENTVAMRQLTRFRMALVDNCGDCKRRTIALLDQVFPEYADLFSDTFGVCLHQETDDISEQSQSWTVRRGESEGDSYRRRQFFWRWICQERLCVSDQAACRAAHVSGNPD